MILMPQIYDAIANDNARYKRNELECHVYACYLHIKSGLKQVTCQIKSWHRNHKNKMP